MIMRIRGVKGPRSRCFRIPPYIPPGRLPLAPSETPPRFIIPAGSLTAGVYMVDPRNTTPPGVDIGSLEPAVTSFIFRVVNIELFNIGYYWLVGGALLTNLELIKVERFLFTYSDINYLSLTAQF